MRSKMKTKFYAQRDGYSCGAIVALNILKWKDRTITYKDDFRQVKRKVKCNKDGTYLCDLLKFLNKDKDIKIHKLTSLKPSQKLKIINSLSCKDQIILIGLECWNLEKKQYSDGHFTLISRTTNQFVEFINIGLKTTRRCRKDKVQKMLSKNGYITKKQKVVVDCIYLIEKNI